MTAGTGSLSKPIRHRSAPAAVSWRRGGRNGASSGSGTSLSPAPLRFSGPSTAGTARNLHARGSRSMNPLPRSRAVPAPLPGSGTKLLTRSSIPVTEACFLTLPDVDELSPRMLGIDEHRFRSVRFFRDPESSTWIRHEPWMTTIVDLDTGQVLGIVDGRDHKGVGDWFFARPLSWRLGVQAVAIDPSAAFRKALRMWRSRTAVAVDHVHLVSLANQAHDQGPAGQGPPRPRDRQGLGAPDAAPPRRRHTHRRHNHRKMQPTDCRRSSPPMTRPAASSRMESQGTAQGPVAHQFPRRCRRCERGTLGARGRGSTAGDEQALPHRLPVTKALVLSSSYNSSGSRPRILLPWKLFSARGACSAIGASMPALLRNREPSQYVALTLRRRKLFEQNGLIKNRCSRR